MKQAGDFDYEKHGHGYATQRRTDPRIAALVHAALGSARTVLNVGAGSGSYEPPGREVTAVEPSAAMRAQRPPQLSAAVDAVAEALPFDDQSFDASMAMITVHQWANLERGLQELRRVTRGPIVILAFDADALDRFWLADYVPELIAAQRGRDPAVARIAGILGGETSIQAVPIPADCVDGFFEAYYARPERYLDDAVRRGQSPWKFVAPEVEERFVRELRGDLASGAWDERYGEWRRRPHFEGSLRLITSVRRRA